MKSVRFAKQILVSAWSHYFSINSHTLFGAWPMLRPIQKDINSAIYKFRCHCNGDYVGRTESEVGCMDQPTQTRQYSQE